MAAITEAWSFDLKVADAELSDDELAAVLQVRVLQDTRAPGTFEILADAWDPDKQLFRLVDKFKLGAKVELGVVHKRTRYPLFAGELTAVEFTVAGDDAPTVRLRGYDVRHRLMRGRSTRAFEKSKDSEAAEKIAGELGVTIKATASPVVHAFLLQADQSDYEFLSQRAAAIGYELGVGEFGKSLVFRPLKLDGPKSAELDLGGDVLEFHGTCSALSQFDEVEVLGWDPVKGQAIKATAAAGDLALAGSSASGPAHAKSAFAAFKSSRGDLSVASVGEAEALAKSTLLLSALEHVVADVVARGDPALAAGKVVAVMGAGKRFGANYYVERAIHTLTRAGGVYETNLKLRKLAS